MSASRPGARPITAGPAPYVALALAREDADRSRCVSVPLDVSLFLFFLFLAALAVALVAGRARSHRQVRAVAARRLADTARGYQRTLGGLEAQGPAASPAHPPPPQVSPYRTPALDPDAAGGERAECVRVLLRLGAIASRRGAFAQAEDDCRRALAVAERASGPESPRLLEVLDPLARVLVAADRLADAEAVARRALDLAKASPDPLVRASAETRLGSVLSQTDDVEGAKALFVRAVARLDALPDPPDGLRCWTLHAQGLCFFVDGEKDEAERALSRGADLADRALAALPGALGGDPTTEHHTAAELLNALAFVRCEMGRLAAAELSCERALALSGHEAGASAAEPQQAHMIDTLAEIRRRQGRLREARALADRALGAVLRPEGREGLLAGLCRGTRARVLRDEGRLDEAHAEQERGLALVEGARGRGWLWRKMREDFGGE